MRLFHDHAVYSVVPSAFHARIYGVGSVCVYDAWHKAVNMLFVLSVYVYYILYICTL